MAKKIQIDIEVNGKMEKATVSTKKLRKALDGASDATDNATAAGDKYQRGLKGVGQQSANATKNNAKMIQGMGGLVGVYASLAAQLFAISAAFQFLKRAGDLQVLQSGQTAYASATGVALKSLTNDLIEATEAQITFRDAAQAAAIGTASGLSRDQLTKLGTAAKDVSIVLGRDVTDSFNRLVRGVTKAEPELLDELGIVLRLKDATEKYASALGKNANDLTAFERSQAVANDVLSQTEQKYSKILAVTGGSVNQFNQLGKAFDDVVMKVQNVAAVIAGPFSKVLTETPSLAIASLGLLLKGPLAALGINFGELAEGARKSAAESQAYYEMVSAEAAKATLDQEKLAAAFQQTATSVPKANVDASPVLQRMQAGTMTKKDRANLSKALKAAENNYNKHGIVVKGIFKGMSIEMVRDIQFAFEQMTLAEEKKLSRTKVYATKAEALYAGIAAGIKGMGAALATAATKLLSFLGYVGIFVTLFQLAKDAIGFGNEKLSASEELYRKNRESLAELNKELGTFAEVQRILAEGTVSLQSFANIGTAIGQRNLRQAGEDYKLYLRAQEQDLANQKSLIARRKVFDENPGIYSQKEGMSMYSQEERTARDAAVEENPMRMLTKEEKAAKEFFDNMLKSLRAVEQETGVSQEAFTEFRRVLTEGGTAEQFNKTRDAAINMANAIQEGKRIAEDAKNAIQGFITSFSPLNAAETSLQKIDERLENIATQEAGASFDNLVPVFEQVKDEFGNMTFEQKMELDYTTGTMEPVFEMETVKGLPFDHPLMVEKRLLEEQRPIIDTINKNRHEGQVNALKLQQKLATSVKGQDAAQRALQELENKSLTLESQKAAKEEERRMLMEDVTRLQKGELTPAQQRRKEILDEEIELLRLQNEEVEYQKDLEDLILETKRAQIKLRDEQSILGAEQLALQISQKAFELDKQRLEIQRQLRKDRMDEAIANETARNPFADEQQLQAQAALELAREEQSIRLPFIQQEYNNKVAMINLEYELLDAKRLQTANEMTLLAARLKEEGKNDPEKLVQAAEATAIAAKLNSASYDDAKRAALQLALSSKEASEYGLGKAVRDAERTVEALRPINKLLDDAADSFDSSLNDAFNAMFASLSDKTMDLGEKLKEIGRGFLEELQKSLTQQFLVQPITDFVGNAVGDFKDKFITKKEETPVAPSVTAPVAPPVTGGGFMSPTGGGGALAQGANAGKLGAPGAGIAGAVTGGGGLDGMGLGASAAMPVYVTMVQDPMGGIGGGEGGAAGSMSSILGGGEGSGEGSGEDAQTEATNKLTSATMDSALETGRNVAALGSAVFALTGNEEAAKKLGMVTAALQLIMLAKEAWDKFMQPTQLAAENANTAAVTALTAKMTAQAAGSAVGGAGGGRYGGIFSNGSKMPGYSAGGIASGPQAGYPATLHGTEAVVPLPNGNEIPVELSGAGANQQTNNSVVVNVDASGGTQTQNREGDAENLGKAISTAVQQELQRQKRPGGILSPIGAA